MTSKALASMLVDMDITRSHSRPHTSNDNPFSDYAGAVIMPSSNQPGQILGGQRAAAV